MEEIRTEDLWSLDITIAKLLLPYLTKFREVLCGFPANLNSEKEWKDILDKIIKAFEIIANEEFFLEHDEQAVKDGLDLFREYYFSLWI